MLCEVVFIGLLLVLRYIAIHTLRMQEDFGFGSRMLRGWKLVAVRRTADLSFRLRLHFGLRQSGSAVGAGVCGTAEGVPF